MIKVDWWLKLIDDKVLQMYQWMDNTKVAFATENTNFIFKY